ncbi:MAG: 4Fe-4S dicluster domain-containing protein, partial [Burkholderiaceae bacterium]
TKCTMCVDRLREGLKPACVASCPNRALDFGPLEELRRKYPQATRTATGFKAEDVAKTRPSILFRARAPRA